LRGAHFQVRESTTFLIRKLQKSFRSIKGLRESNKNASLPDLIRQSMRHLSMDHRVKPGGDD
jgi:hypothetical protein